MWCLLDKNTYFCSMLQFENQKIKQIVRKAFPVVTLVVMLYSCASIGRPDGGPYDETPPRFIGSTPAAGALNNQRTKVSLLFDEFIKLEKATEKVVVSPPQVQQPEIKASGKRIQVNLLDSLKANTTYTIDFSDAIVDNNEGNPLGNFTFTFSTGTQIDTMEVSGTVLDASNLEPIKGILVGLHSNLNDSAFTKLPFDRVARTDSRGRFSIRGVAPGKYRIYGLMDADQTFTFNQKSEVIAFNDSLVIPRMEERIRMDTAWVDSLTYDTIVERKYMHYLPDDLILRAFKEFNYSQYLIKSERLVPQKFTFYFAGQADTLPTLKGLNFDERDAFVIEKNPRNDTIHYWLKDSLLFKQDTLAISLTYLYTDTLNQLVSRTDTLNLVSKQKYKKEEPEKKKKKKRKTYEGKKIQEFAELKPGDYVVHENHGLGIYQGIEKVEVDTVTRDYMKISYADGGILYIPATQMDLIQKYAGADTKPPKLNKLGTPQWKKTKGQVKKAVQLIAKDLVKLYATRQQTEGYVYGPDTVWQREFEEMFPFEETEDQLRAIEDTKKDMESTKIMDRLICGDVGYGKTEIAIRAAFKAVQEGKQVVYLVPTTILAQQHYNTFIQRFKDFPVRVDLMSRFRTQAQQKKTVEDLKKGLVDIVIGTHRVLSKDVGYKDLGLLIIDEEQRFGVTHKEKIKKLRENIDVLTLTATPIPRTLHMSLIGIRDMSVLEEAPMDRMPIQTYVMEYNDEMVREAIERELARGGQVYYVYNRVENIADLALRVQKLVPDARVSYAHGQMNEHQLEDIMYDFINGDIDVLVSTTIIETGLDIANANTMIIQDADRFGLSQLYQLRGRVGRSNRMAYAFLLYQRDKMLKEVAEKRLAAIREFTDLGSGFKIAMRDLEIRGAGNLLGKVVIWQQLDMTCTARCLMRLSVS